MRCEIERACSVNPIHSRLEDNRLYYISRIAGNEFQNVAVCTIKVEAVRVRGISIEYELVRIGTFLVCGYTGVFEHMT